MARQREDDILEPILPKHPPTERDVLEAEAEAAAAAAPSATAGHPSWDRIVLVACAVVATLALVVVAARTSSIAKDQKVQTCQIRVYAAEQLSDSSSGFSGRGSQRRLAQELAECVGLDPAVDEETD